MQWDLLLEKLQLSLGSHCLSLQFQGQILTLQ
jgi:hypothetical protein